MLDETTILLCGGGINYTNLPVGTNLSNAMIPVNGKPVIGWILDDLASKEIFQVVIVLREQNVRLLKFLQRAYENRMDIRYAVLSQNGTIVQSLRAGLQVVEGTGLVRIVLGDTLIRDAYAGDRSFVYVSPVDESHRWCLAVTNAAGQVVEYVDKQEHALRPFLALAGYYHLRNGERLRQVVDEAVQNHETELSHVLRRYGEVEPIIAIQAQQWFDFGNIDRLVAARQQLLTTRSFNTLTVNPILGTITKTSEYNEKLQDELDWYLAIPDELKVLSPRIIRYQQVNGRLEIAQEYYGYPTLAELYVFGELHSDTWISILKRVLGIHSEFKRFPGSLPEDAILAMYAKKTFERIELMRKYHHDWRELLNTREVIFNGRTLRGLPLLEDAIWQYSTRLARNAQVSIIHGDLCFSNILFDLNNQIMRLIDPRGNFGRKGIFGDPRYDIAKLRHSVCGYYDFITTDMFELQEKSGSFNGRMYANGASEEICQEFNDMIADLGYHLDEIKFLEGLLFISMLPLHQDQSHRQMMMFLSGLSLLNEVL